ncbi:MAG: phage portal protein [Tannerellaceae bacterium]|nr:phage portal protein [Tannerellaceae bacterium]
MEVSNLNMVAGQEQEFAKLISEKNVDGIKEQMSSHESAAIAALKEYNTDTHPIMERPDKQVYDKKGNWLKTESVWRLPVPYPVYINEISLVFLYGRPVKWTQDSQGTDEVFQRFIAILKDVRFNSRIRQCKRLAGAEETSAMLWRVFRNKKGQPDVQVKILAKSLGDEIRTQWDQYGNLLSAGWGYFLREGTDVVYHFDIFTPNIIFRCKQVGGSWQIIEEENLIGKIPLIIFQQKKEWGDVFHLINREEHIASKTGDTNDYFADPIALMSASLIENLPEKQEPGKVLIVDDEEGVENAAKYLTWDNAPASKEKEIEWLQNHILTKSFTPKIDMETMRSLSGVSGKALKQLMFLADIKASKHKETHEDLLDRIAKLVLAIIGNVTDIRLSTQVEKTVIGHEFQEPFAEDIAEVLTDLGRAKDDGGLSEETYIEMNPLIKDPILEKERIRKEREERLKKRDDIFGRGL